MRIRDHCLFIIFWGVALGSSATAQLTITNPAESTKASVSNGAIRQVSNSVPAGDYLSGQTQIRVKIRYLMVDDATRTAIYQEFSPSAIKRHTSVPRTAESVDLGTIASPLQCEREIHSPSRATTCVLDAATLALVLSEADESTSSGVMHAPGVILIDGEQAEINDVVQRPFVVDMETDGDLLKPTAHVLDDGTRVRLLASLTGTREGEPTIQLTTEIVVSSVLDVKTDRVFGIGDEPFTVQVPLQQVTKVVALERIAAGQTLMIDPHVSKTKRVEHASGVPVLTKIPYVGRTFKNVGVATVEQHMMVLLQPTIENGHR